MKRIKVKDFIPGHLYEVIYAHHVMTWRVGDQIICIRVEDDYRFYVDKYRLVTDRLITAFISQDSYAGKTVEFKDMGTIDTHPENFI